MSDVVAEDENSYTVRAPNGKRVRVAKTPGNVARYGRGKVDTGTDFESWDAAKLKSHDEALQFLEMAKQPTPDGSARRDLLMQKGGLDPAKASQMAAYRAWRYGLNKTGGDDTRLRAMGLSDEQIATARAETAKANQKQLATAYDIFVPKTQPTKTVEMPAEEVSAGAKPKKAPPAAKPEGAGAVPASMPPPAPQAPSVVPAAAAGHPPVAAPVAPVAPIVQPQPVMTIQGQPVPTDPPMPPPDEEQLNPQLLAQAQ